MVVINQQKCLFVLGIVTRSLFFKITAICLLCFGSHPVFSYNIGADDIFISVVDKSREIKSLKNKLISKQELTEAERKFYYPTLNVSLEYQDFYGKNDPTLEEDAELVLSIESVLYSDVTHDKITSAVNNSRAAAYDLQAKEDQLYFDIMAELLKIERSRQFLGQSEAISQQMDQLIDQISTAVAAGVSPRSYLRETQLIKVRFYDIVSTVQSDINNYFTQLYAKTGYEVDFNERYDVGLPLSFLQEVGADSIDFSADLVVKRNLPLLSKYHTTEALKHDANAQHEKLKVTAFDDTNVGAKDNATNASGDVRESSAAGVRLEYNLFDYKKIKTKSSTYHNYIAEQEKLDFDRENLRAQSKELSERYTTLTSRRDNLLEQIDLSENLIKTQEKEILIDRIEFIDIVKSLSELMQTYVSLLNNDIQLYDVIINYRTLASLRFVSVERQPN